MVVLAMFDRRIKAGEKCSFQVPVAELPDGAPVNVPVVICPDDWPYDCGKLP